MGGGLCEKMKGVQKRRAVINQTQPSEYHPYVTLHNPSYTAHLLLSAYKTWRCQPVLLQGCTVNLAMSLPFRLNTLDSQQHAVAGRAQRRLSYRKAMIQEAIFYFCFRTTTCVCVFACINVCVIPDCLVPTKVRRGCCIPWN